MLPLISMVVLHFFVFLSGYLDPDLNCLNHHPDEKCHKHKLRDHVWQNNKNETAELCACQHRSHHNRDDRVVYQRHIFLGRVLFVEL